MFLVIFILLEFHILFLSPYIVHGCALEACLLLITCPLLDMSP